MDIVCNRSKFKVVDVKQQQPLIRNLLKFKSYLFSALVLFKMPYLGVDPLDSIRVMLSPAVELHRTHVLWTSLLPGVAIAQPIVSLLHLDNDINLYQGQLLRGGGRRGVTTRCVCVWRLSAVRKAEKYQVITLTKDRQRHTCELTLLTCQPLTIF